MCNGPGLAQWTAQWDARAAAFVGAGGGLPGAFGWSAALAGAITNPAVIRADRLLEPYVGDATGTGLRAVILNLNPNEGDATHNLSPPHPLPGAVTAAVTAPGATYSTVFEAWVPPNIGTRNWWRGRRGKFVHRVLQVPGDAPDPPTNVFGLEMSPWHSMPFHGVHAGHPGLRAWVDAEVLPAACQVARSIAAGPLQALCVSPGDGSRQPLAVAFGRPWDDLLATRPDDFQLVRRWDQVSHPAWVPWPNNAAGTPTNRTFALYRRIRKCSAGATLHMLVTWYVGGIHAPGAAFDPVLRAIIGPAPE